MNNSIINVNIIHLICFIFAIIIILCDKNNVNTLDDFFEFFMITCLLFIVYAVIIEFIYKKNLNKVILLK